MDNKLINEIISLAENGGARGNDITAVYSRVYIALKKSLGITPYAEQIGAALALTGHNMVQMQTGEGKTFSAVFAACYEALSGGQVMILTFNDYLARRDYEWTKPVYDSMGVSLGCITADTPRTDRRKIYSKQGVYLTAKEAGFDYLRDNMVTYEEELIQRELNFAIVDEVDSILIDEARTPLIISGQGVDSSGMYVSANSFVKTLLKDTDYKIDEKDNQISLTDEGVAQCEQYFDIQNFSDPDNMELNHYVNQALRANYLMKRDVDYIVQDGEILIVDEFTGRLMYGRRFSNGLHQAIEAKEGVNIRAESKTLATITLQNYFRMYQKLSGMTGTAKTEEDEFRDIYNMDVVVVPTNLPIARVDKQDAVYAHESGKYAAIVNRVAEVHEKGQPVLVGTISVEISELISQQLKKRGIKHNVLNAKHHEREAEIVAEAGRLGAVTIATNMAGRGTDIILGGNPEFEARKEMKRREYTPEQLAFMTGITKSEDPELNEARDTYKKLCKEYEAERKPEQEKVKELGGLCIIGTERHESRRIDNQLRGRAGRQGDPGESRFYISLEDDLMRLFGSERLMKVFTSLGVAENEQIEHKMLSNAIQKAQEKIEFNNFGIRKNLLDYDQVNNDQREIIYKERRQVLDGENMRDTIYKMITDIVDSTVDMCFSDEVESVDWNLDEFNPMMTSIIPIEPLTTEKIQGKRKDEVKQQLKEEAVKLYEMKEAEFPEAEQLRELERVVLLKSIDSKWMDHIDDMELLRQGIGLVGYGQKDPVVEYKTRAFKMFNDMIDAIQEDTVRMLYHVHVEQKIEREQVAKVTGTNKDDTSVKKPVQRKEDKVYPNDPCPCGSGKKYKQCCGRKLMKA